MLESAESNSDESESEKWEISCICGQKEDDGEEMVQCNQCILLVYFYLDKCSPRILHYLFILYVLILMLVKIYM